MTTNKWIGKPILVSSPFARRYLNFLGIIIHGIVLLCNGLQSSGPSTTIATLGSECVSFAVYENTVVCSTGGYHSYDVYIYNCSLSSCNDAPVYTINKPDDDEFDDFDGNVVALYNSTLVISGYHNNFVYQCSVSAGCNTDNYSVMYKNEGCQPNSIAVWDNTIAIGCTYRNEVFLFSCPQSSNSGGGGVVGPPCPSQDKYTKLHSPHKAYGEFGLSLAMFESALIVGAANYVFVYPNHAKLKKYAILPHPQLADESYCKTSVAAGPSFVGAVYYFLDSVVAGAFLFPNCYDEENTNACGASFIKLVDDTETDSSDTDGLMLLGGIAISNDLVAVKAVSESGFEKDVSYALYLFNCTASYCGDKVTVLVDQRASGSSSPYVAMYGTMLVNQLVKYSDMIVYEMRPASSQNGQQEEYLSTYPPATKYDDDFFPDNYEDDYAITRDQIQECLETHTDNPFEVLQNVEFRGVFLAFLLLCVSCVGINYCLFRYFPNNKLARLMIEAETIFCARALKNFSAIKKEAGAAFETQSTSCGRSSGDDDDTQCSRTGSSDIENSAVAGSEIYTATSPLPSSSFAISSSFSGNGNSNSGTTTSCCSTSPEASRDIKEAIADTKHFSRHIMIKKNTREVNPFFKRYISNEKNRYFGLSDSIVARGDLFCVKGVLPPGRLEDFVLHFANRNQFLSMLFSDPVGNPVSAKTRAVAWFSYHGLPFLMYCITLYAANHYHITLPFTLKTAISIGTFPIKFGNRVLVVFCIIKLRRKLVRWPWGHNFVSALFVLLSASMLLAAGYLLHETICASISQWSSSPLHANVFVSITAPYILGELLSNLTIPIVLEYFLVDLRGQWKSKYYSTASSEDEEGNEGIAASEKHLSNRNSGMTSDSCRDIKDCGDVELQEVVHNSTNAVGSDNGSGKKEEKEVVGGGKSACSASKENDVYNDDDDDGQMHSSQAKKEEVDSVIQFALELN